MASIRRLNREKVLRWVPENPAKNSWLREAHTGLCLRVRPSRWEGEWRREYFVCYRWLGKPKYKLLGPVDHLGLEEAREESISIRLKVSKAQRMGEPNPLDRVSESDFHSMSQLADRYQSLVEKSAAAKKKDQARWENHILPYKPPGSLKSFGKIWVHEVTSLHLEQLKNAMVETPIGFNRARSLLSHAFNKATDWNMIPASAHASGWTNPIQRVKPYKENRRERIYRPREIAAILQALEDLTQKALNDWNHGQKLNAKLRARTLLGIRILAFTGARPDELLRIERKWIHWQRSLIDLPSAKGDQDAKEGRLIALGRRRLEDLRILDELAETSPYLFPGRLDLHSHLATGAFRKSWTAVKEAADQFLDTRLSSDRSAELYAWRHTIVSGHSEPSVNVDVATIGDFVGHKRSGTTEIYRHTLAPRLVETAQKVEDWLTATAEESLELVQA